MWNLLTNAIKFTPRGGSVEVVLAAVQSHLELAVIDSGEGIDPEFLPHVFDRFRQSDSSTTRRHGGLGLGLAIVKQLVELHGGTVHAHSNGVGRGSRFIIALPILPISLENKTDDHPRATPASGVTAGQTARMSLDGLHILVVDDEADARTLMKRVLEDCGATVTLAASADEGFNQIHTRRPDVLVSDIGMPQEDGYSLLRRVRDLSAERGGRTPAVALTAYARTEDRIKAINAGFQHHVVKPVDPNELITMVANLVPQKSR